MRIRQATKEGSIPILPGGVFDSTFPHSETKRGRVQGGGMIVPTITVVGAPEIIRYIVDKDGNEKFRRLTEREVFRLQGVSDNHIDRIQASGISGSRQYRLAGNSICVDVLAGIFKNLFVGCDKPEDYLF